MQNAPEFSRPLLDDFFRRQYSQCVAYLTRRLGHQHLELAEESVQEALARALRVWPLQGVPDAPESWVLQVAYRHAIDVCRRSQRFQALAPTLQALVEATPPAASPVQFDGELYNDTLAMMFMCCHPALSPLSRMALTLKVVSGFGVPEIAAACFATESTIAQRIVRAKSRLRSLDIAMEIPAPEKLPERLSSVLDALYLVFNEGYTCRDTDTPLQEPLLEEALRLLALLLAHPVGEQPHAHALAALMCFQSSRTMARLSPEKQLVPLLKQERSMWDKARIQRGLQHLAQAATGDNLTEYHLLAGIAACHATAPSAAMTPWSRIAALYDDLVRLNGTFVTQLNRAVAYAHAHSPTKGLAILNELSQRKALQDYHLLAAARADCLVQLGRQEEAHAQYIHAASLAPSLLERQFLQSQADSICPATAQQSTTKQGAQISPHKHNPPEGQEPQ